MVGTLPPSLFLLRSSSFGGQVELRRTLLPTLRIVLLDRAPHPPGFAEPVIGRAFARPSGFPGRPLPPKSRPRCLETLPPTPCLPLTVSDTLKLPLLKI